MHNCKLINAFQNSEKNKLKINDLALTQSKKIW